MALPGLTLNVVDGNLGLVDLTGEKPVVWGPCSGGVANTKYTFSRPTDVIATLGRGQAVTAASTILDIAGGSVDVWKSAASVVSALSSVTQSGAGPLITLSGTPTEFFNAIVRVRLGGALGVARFDYSLDGGETYGSIRIVPAGGTFAVPDAGFTITFPSGTYVLDETYTFTCTPATFNSTDLDAVRTAMLLTNNRYKLLLAAGQSASASAAATIAGSISGYLTQFAAQFRLIQGFVDGGDDSVSNEQTSFVAVEDIDLSIFYGKDRIRVANPIEGWRKPFLPNVYHAAAMAAKFSRATNLAWVGIGPPPTGGRIPKCDAISFDERQQGEQLHDVKINTTMTRVERPGAFYFVNSLTKSPAGSDFRYTHWKLAFNKACEVAIDVLSKYINSSQRVIAGGYIDPRDAARIDKEVNAALQVAVMQPLNEQGFKGFFSEVLFAIDQTSEILVSRTLRGDLRAVPLSNVEQVILTAGLAASLATESEETEEEAA